MKTAKYLLAIALSVIAVNFGRSAHADTLTTYTINFTTASGSPTPMSGSFTYDSTNPQFTNFLVNWNGEVYDLTASASSPSIAGTGCDGEASTAAYAFALMSQTLTNCQHASIDSYFWQAYVYSPATPPDTFYFNYEGAGNSDTIYALGTQTNVNGPLVYGGWTITAAEPSSLLLLGTALIGGIGAMRRKPARRDQHDLADLQQVLVFLAELDRLYAQAPAPRLLVTSLPHSTKRRSLLPPCSTT